MYVCMYVCMYTIIHTEYCITVKIIDINSCFIDDTL